MQNGVHMSKIFIKMWIFVRTNNGNSRHVCFWYGLRSNPRSSFRRRCIKSWIYLFTSDGNCNNQRGEAAVSYRDGWKKRIIQRSEVPKQKKQVDRVKPILIQIRTRN